MLEVNSLVFNRLSESFQHLDSDDSPWFIVNSFLLPLVKHYYE